MCHCTEERVCGFCLSEAAEHAAHGEIRKGIPMGDKLTGQLQAELEVWTATVDLWWGKVKTMVAAGHHDDAYALMAELRSAQDSLRGVLAGLTYVPSEVENG